MRVHTSDLSANTGRQTLIIPAHLPVEGALYCTAAAEGNIDEIPDRPLLRVRHSPRDEGLDGPGDVLVARG